MIDTPDLSGGWGRLGGRGDPADPEALALGRMLGPLVVTRLASSTRPAAGRPGGAAALHDGGHPSAPGRSRARIPKRVVRRGVQSCQP